MRKVLIHTLVFPPDANSAAYIVADLARELKTAHGHDVRVLTTTPHYNVIASNLAKQPMTPAPGWGGAVLRSDFEGIPCYHVRVPPVKGGLSKRISTALRFHVLGWRLAQGREMHCDVVLSLTPPLSIAPLSAWIAKRRGGKSIFVVQDIQPDSLATQGRIKNRLFLRLLRALERRAYQMSDAVCSISEGMVRTLRPRVPKRTLLREIPNFVNTDLYRPLPRHNDFSKAHGLDSVFSISYAGNLGNAQDFTPVTAAARRCKDLPIRFLLAGGGIKEQALRREAAEGGLTNLEMCGYQPMETTPWINASSDLCLVLLSPHVRNFSFPSKIYTLMACGKPVLLYGHPDSDVAHFVRKTGIGWVVPNGDTDGFVAAVRRLHVNRAELEESGRRAVAAVQERFTVQAVGRQYHELIAEMLQSQGSRS